MHYKRSKENIGRKLCFESLTLRTLAISESRFIPHFGLKQRSRMQQTESQNTSCNNDLALMLYIYICNELPPTHPFVNIVSIDATHSNGEFCCPTSCTHITNTINVKIQRDVNFVNFMNDCRFAKINTRNIWRKDTENGEQETFF